MEPNTNADGATATATKRPVPRGEVEETGETQGVRGAGEARETQEILETEEAREA